MNVAGTTHLEGTTNLDAHANLLLDNKTRSTWDCHLRTTLDLVGAIKQLLNELRIVRLGVGRKRAGLLGSPEVFAGLDANDYTETLRILLAMPDIRVERTSVDGHDSKLSHGKTRGGKSRHLD
jgi:hypothetical protein